MTYRKSPPEVSANTSKGLNYRHRNNSNRCLHPVNIPVRAQGRIIGYLEGKCFRKRVIGSKHMLRKPPSWCISKEAFCGEILPNTETIIIEDVENGLIYECPTEVFAEHAFEIQRGNFEPQLALTLNYWERQRNGHHQLGLFEETRSG